MQLSLLAYLTISQKALVLILSLCAYLGTSSVYAEDYIDDFERDRLSPIWARVWFTGDDSGISGDIARQGNSSVKLTVHQGDHRLFGKSGQATERNELNERDRVPVGRDISYRFSVYLPPNFPIADVRLVMGQWKQTALALWKKHSPAIAQRYRNGRFSITINTNDGQLVLYETGSREDPALLGEWTDFEYFIRFAKDDSGYLRVRLNGVVVVDYTGRLGYSDDLGTTYFRMGLYRDTMIEPMTVHFDEFRRKIYDSKPY